MTDLEFEAWLADPDAVRCLLVEVSPLVDGEETPRYISSVGYVTGPGETPPNTPYLPLIMGGVKFTETLALDSASLSYGDIELNNADGDFDLWLKDIWVNRDIKVFTGDVRWPRADFVQVFGGVIADIDSKNRTCLNIKMRDKLERLNVPVTETKLGGTTQSKDELLPLTFGEVHNMTPLLIDPALHTYQVHQGPIRRVIEVRDNGVPVSVTADIMEGKFALSGTPAGTITASVQGDMNPDWGITVAAEIRALATRFGQEELRFLPEEFDDENWTAFDAANPQPVGICMTSRVNVLDACQQLAKSVGAQLMVSRKGLLRLVKLQIPGNNPETAPLITERDMVAQSLAVASRPAMIAAVKIGYVKNWTVQQGLQTGITEESKNRFATEWDSFTARYAELARKYKLFLEPQQRDTLLLRRLEAEPEAWRLLDMYSVPRTIYRFEGYARMLTLELGQAVLLQHYRFNLGEIEGGTPGVVVSLSPDWNKGRCTVEVLV